MGKTGPDEQNEAVVWRFDRFARSVSHLLRALETFRSLGIEFVSYTEAIDTSTPVGKMTFTVLAAVGELERSLIIERVRAGVRDARAKGKRLGRPKVVVDPVRIAALRAQGHGWKRIAKQLDCGVGTVLRIAKGSKSLPNRRKQRANKREHEQCRLQTIATLAQIQRAQCERSFRKGQAGRARRRKALDGKMK